MTSSTICGAMLNGRLSHYTHRRRVRPTLTLCRTGGRGSRAGPVPKSFEPLAALYAERASAVLVAGHGRAGDDLVATQDHVLTVDALFRTLAVEATVHHLDLWLGEPSEEGLAETRRVLDGLLGRPAPIEDAVRYALIGTGRESPTADEVDAFGADAGRLPLFG